MIGPTYRGFIVERGTWTPTDGDVSDAESAAASSLTAAIQAGTLGRGKAKLPSRLHTYVRRYTGSGMGRMRIDFFCESEAELASAPPSARTSVRGGGDCFLHADYTVGVGFSTWSVNAGR